MRFTFISIFPEMIEQTTQYGVLGQSIKKGLLEFDCVNPRDFTEDVHKTVDDKPYGGGDGMLMLFDPLEKALNALKKTDTSSLKKVIHLSPQGAPLNDKKARELSDLDHIVWVCSRYAGVDQRFINSHIDEELSIGDFVISGGEMAALVATDAIARKVPGVLGNSSSVTEESFAKNGYLEAPQFTRPEKVGELGVPQILLSGHHKKISEWQDFMSFYRTLVLRPDLIELNPPEKSFAEKSIEYLRGLSREDLDSCGLSESSDLERLMTQVISKLI